MITRHLTLQLLWIALHENSQLMLDEIHLTIILGNLFFKYLFQSSCLNENLPSKYAININIHYSFRKFTFTQNGHRLDLTTGHRP